MREILPGLFQWSQFNAEKQINFNGLLLCEEDRCLIIDPPPMTGEAEAKLLVSGKCEAILITNLNHVRDAKALQVKTSAPVWMNEKDAVKAPIVVTESLSPGDVLPFDLVAVGISEGKSPGETALLWKKEECMILGDALIGKPEGELNLLPPAKYANPDKAKEGVRVLLEYAFKHIVVGDGVNVLDKGREAVEDFLKRAQV